jgi:hypothetical protein
VAIITKKLLAEQCMNLIEGGDLAAASSIGYNELMVSIGQVINQLLKTDYFASNIKMGEIIPNGTVLALYEGIECQSSNGKTQCTLPIKPNKLPRNMGIWAVYIKKDNQSNYDYDNECIPLQMGQAGLIKSQSMISELFGQVAYECFGDKLFFTKDIKALFPDIQIAMRLAVMDISQYSEYDILPLLPEMEWTIVQEVVKMYSSQPVPNKVVDATVSEQKSIEVTQQKQAD